MRTYLGFIHPPEDGSEWGVTFPDVPGCVSAGASFEEAVEAGREALSGHLAIVASAGDPLPPARTLAELRVDPTIAGDLDGALVQVIAPLRIAGACVRIDVTLDAGLLRSADRAAEARGLSRSAFIEAALASAVED